MGAIGPDWAPRYFSDVPPPWALDQVAAAFLRECRVHSAPLQQLATVRAALRRGAIARAALELRGHLDGLTAGADDVALLCRAVDDACAGVSLDVDGADQRHAAALRCRIAAELLDTVVGARLVTCLANRLDASTAVAPGQPYPRVRPRLTDLFSGRLTTRPDRQDEFPIDHLPSLAIADDSDVQLRFDFSLSPLLPIPTRGTLLAGVFPISGVVDDGGDDEAMQVRRPVGDELRFVVEPVNPGHNERALLRLLAAADAQGCTIAIVPELCVGGGAVVAARRWLADHAASLELVACGSAHHDEGGRRYNRSTVLIRERDGRRVKAFHHDKFNPFGYGQAGNDAEPIYEAIDCPVANVTSWVRLGAATPGEPSRALWSYAALICKDLFRERVDAALQRARVGLLLVPAMSERLVTFEQIAMGTARTQTITVIANQDPTEIGLVVVQPVEGAGLRTWSRPRSGIEVIVLCD